MSERIDPKKGLENDYRDSDTLKMAKGLMRTTITMYQGIFDGTVEGPTKINATYEAIDITRKHSAIFALISIAQSLERMVGDAHE